MSDYNMMCLDFEQEMEAARMERKMFDHNHPSLVNRYLWIPHRSTSDHFVELRYQDALLTPQAI